MITAAIPATVAMSTHPRKSGANTSKRGFATSRTALNVIAAPTNTIFGCRDVCAKGSPVKSGSMMMTKTGVPSLQRYAWISMAAAHVTIVLKGVAWKLTGSVGLLSDAIESFVNLAGALMALWMLSLAEQPADGF